MTHKSRQKFVKVHVLKCWMASFESGRLLYNLDILYGGLGKGKMQFLIIKKYNKKISAVIFFQFLVIKALDPYWCPSYHAGSGSGAGKNEYGSTALPPLVRRVCTL